MNSKSLIYVSIFLLIALQLHSTRRVATITQQMQESNDVREEGIHTMYRKTVQELISTTDTLYHQLAEEKPKVVYIKEKIYVRDTVVLPMPQIPFEDTSYVTLDTIDRTKVIIPPKRFKYTNKNYHISGVIGLTGLTIDSLRTFPDLRVIPFKVDNHRFDLKVLDFSGFSLIDTTFQLHFNTNPFNRKLTIK